MTLDIGLVFSYKQKGLTSFRQAFLFYCGNYFFDVLSYKLFWLLMSCWCMDDIEIDRFVISVWINSIS
jgi:hypothetical protein